MLEVHRQQLRADDVGEFDDGCQQDGEEDVHTDDAGLTSEDAEYSLRGDEDEDDGAPDGQPNP